MTDAERRVWQMIRQRQAGGFRFRRQVPLGGYIADFVCHEARLAVEIDGGQHDLDSADELKRTRFLEGQGYRVLRFWNTDALQNPEGVWTAIAQALAEASPPPNPPPSRGRAFAAVSSQSPSPSMGQSLLESPSPSMGEGRGGGERRA